MYKEDQKLISFFSFHGRASRLEFFKIYSSTYLFELLNLVYFFDGSSINYIIMVVAISYILLLASLPMTIRRLHDSNLDWKFVFVGFLPNILKFLPTTSIILAIVSILLWFVNLYFLFRKGDTQSNKYGEPYCKNKYTAKTINIICIGILILTIVLAFTRDIIL